MVFVVDQEQRTQLAVERASKGDALDTISTLAHLPPSTIWKAGTAIASLPPGGVIPGTVIATFDKNGNPLTSTAGGQVAVYESHDPVGIRALAPDPDSPQGRWMHTQISLLLSDAVQPLLNGHAYHVVEI